MSQVLDFFNTASFPSSPFVNSITPSTSLLSASTISNHTLSALSPPSSPSSSGAVLCTVSNQPL